jgi:hypothetical protein
METILLIGDSPAPHASRPGDGVRARFFGASLDAALAAGSPPESSRLLAARAASLVGLRRRRSLAAGWARLLRVAYRTMPSGPGQSARAQPGRAAGAVPVCADRVVAAEPAIRELIDRLTAPLPVPARGVAMARVLLTDADSPVYLRRSRVSLTAAVEAAAAQLDPALPLLRS